MTCVVNFVFALSQLQGVEWGWPGRGNPTMNTPRLRRGGGIASSSFILFFTSIAIPIEPIVYFVCNSASEFGAMGSTSFFGVFLP